MKKYFTSTAWLFGEKIFRMSILMLVTILMARYLGPDMFGMYNYAFSYVLLFAVFATLGMEKIISKELLNNKEDESIILASTLFLRLLGAFFLVSIATFLTEYVKPNDKIFLNLVIIFSSAFFFKAFEIIRYWFDSHSMSKYSALAESIAIFVGAIVKVILIYKNADLLAFAYVFVLEALIMALGLSFSYYKHTKNIFHWQVKMSKMKDILSKSWPLLISGALYTIYTKIDQVMLGNMVGNEAVGVYAAAVKISEGWLFIPAIIGVSFFPLMLKAKEKNKELYLKQTQSLLNVMALIGFIASGCIVLVSEPLILLIYGDAFKESASILVVHIWGGIFVSMGAVAYNYYISEGLQVTSMYRAFTGLVVNILLNLLLIPKYGAYGAAIATFVSQFAALYLLNAFSTKTREMFRMQSLALFKQNVFNTFIVMYNFRRNNEK